MAAWGHGRMAVWQHGRKTAWQHGSMAAWPGLWLRMQQPASPLPPARLPVNGCWPAPLPFVRT
eukprot:286719-Chlamydomonas_euryale.AAC.1